MRFLMMSAVTVLLAVGAANADWPPDDPQEGVTSVDFTIEWAISLSGFMTLEDIQRAAGSRGRISERPRTPDGSYTFHWRSQPENGRVGYAVFRLYEDGGIGGSVLTDEGAQIIVNNFGALICDKCSPPINRVGRTPSWADKK